MQGATMRIRLPADTDAERAVVGAMVLRPETIAEVAEQVDADAFHDPTLHAFAAAVFNLHRRGEPIDAATITAELRAAGASVSVAERGPMIADAGVGTVHNLRRHVRRVREVAGVRRLVAALQERAEACGGALEDPGAWAEQTIEELTPLARFARRGTWRHWSDYFSLAINEAKQRHVAGLVPTPWNELNGLLVGYVPPDLVVVAARPGNGKTAFALDTIRYASRRGIPMLMFSLEMTAVQVVQRALSAEGQVDSQRWRSGEFQLGELEMITRAGGRLYEQPVAIVDDVYEINAMRSIARQWRHDRSLFPGYTEDPNVTPPRGLVAIDYLQFAHAKGFKGGMREAEVAYISRQAKELAKELRVPVLLLAQLNREVDKRKGHRPMLADLRESGAVEQDADSVLFIHRPDNYDPKADKGVAEVVVAKNRNGPAGCVKLDFVAHLVTFLEHRRVVYSKGE